MTTPNDPFRLDGSVAIVTGGLGRLGSQYARALTSAGASVSLFDVAVTPRPELQALIDSGAPVSIHAVDATRRAAVDAAVADVAQRFGAPSILVNNAGLGSSPADAALETGRFERYPESAWDAMLESHLKSAFVVYDYRRQDGAEFYKPIGYSVAKSGMLNFTRWLAEYCAPFGMRVNTLVPGGVKEAGHAPAFVAEYVKRTPLGRMAHDDDYNGAIVFLASRASAYMTGAMLVVDGGWTAR